MKIYIGFIIFLFLSVGKISSQDTAMKTFHIDSLPAEGVVFNKGWKFHPGDNPDWSKPGYDESKWEDINPTFDLYYLPQVRKESIGWLRIRIHIDSNLVNIPLAFQVTQFIASEIYLNGTLIHKYGEVSHVSTEVKGLNPDNKPVGIQFAEPNQVFAIRFSVPKNLLYLKHYKPFVAFELRINTVQRADSYKHRLDPYYLLNALYVGIFLILTIIHVGLFLMYKKQKANLYFSISTLSGAIANGLWILFERSSSVTFSVYGLLIDYIFLLTTFNLFLFIAIHNLFSRPKNIYFWAIVTYSILSIMLWPVDHEYGEFFAFFLPFGVATAAAFGIAWQAFRKRQRDSGIIVIGIALYLILYSLFICVYYGFIGNMNVSPGGGIRLNDVFYHLGMISVLIALSLYLSRDFAFTSKELEYKLSEVQNLSAKTIAQEQEKQQILASQKETLELQVTERTAELKQSLENLKTTQVQLIQSEKMASLGELTAGIAHEIQNPLNFVNNFSEVNKELLTEMNEEIEKGNLHEVKAIAKDVIDNQEKINHHGKRADAIVKGMLQHSRVSSGQKEATDLNALADEYLSLAYHGLRAKDKSFNAKLETDFDNSIGKINIIPQDIGRVILNLINNAFYAVNEKKKLISGEFEPTVTVTTKKLNDKVEIIVKDNGMGIRQQFLDKIFQPFFTTKPTGQGTGLGLSLAYDIVKAHGGEIKVETKEASPPARASTDRDDPVEQGQGTDIIIHLPIH